MLLACAKQPKILAFSKECIPTTLDFKEDSWGRGILHTDWGSFYGPA